MIIGFSFFFYDMKFLEKNVRNGHLMTKRICYSELLVFKLCTCSFSVLVMLLL